MTINSLLALLPTTAMIAAAAAAAAGCASCARPWSAMSSLADPPTPGPLRRLVDAAARHLLERLGLLPVDHDA